MSDGVAPATDGCETLSGLTNKIALIDRGTCDFTVKVLNAQAAGAKGVIVANNEGVGETVPMGGRNRSITIPSLMIGYENGQTLRGLTTPNATLRANPSDLYIDGDLDSDVVNHEYGHGLTWRMIGGMSGKIAGAIGEGASDALAMLINGDDRIGEYAFSNPYGIRRFPYAGYPLSYSDVTGGEVHADGEIYAAVIWRLMELLRLTACHLATCSTISSMA